MNMKTLLFTITVTLSLVSDALLHGAMSKKEIAEKKIEMLTIKVDLCSICYEPLDLNKNPAHLIIVDPCNHLFHRACIVAWIQEHAICPNCRGVFNSGIPIKQALSTNNPNRIRALLAAGANINTQYEGHETALEKATRDGNLEVVKILLENGAEVDHQYNDYSPLYTATMYNHTDIVALLLAFGAQIRGAKPLIKAIHNGNAAMVKLLLDHGADSNAKEKGEYATTPLCAAAQAGQANIVRMLLSHGARIEDSGFLGERALHKAAFYGQLEVVKILLDAGADINASRDDYPFQDALYFATVTYAEDFGHLYEVTVRHAQGRAAVEQFLRSLGAKESMCSIQ